MLAVVSPWTEVHKHNLANQFGLTAERSGFQSIPLTLCEIVGIANGCFVVSVNENGLLP